METLNQIEAISIEVINGSTIVTITRNSGTKKHVITEGRDYTAYSGGVILSNDPQNAEINSLFIDLDLLTDKFGATNGIELAVKFAEMGAFRKAASPALTTTGGYSLEETITGEKWIDGSPIYRHVFSFNFNGAYNTSGGYYEYYIDLIHNLEINKYLDAKIVGIKTGLIGNGALTFPIYQTPSNTNEVMSIMGLIGMDRDYIYVEDIRSPNNNFMFYLVIEYTKEGTAIPINGM